MALFNYATKEITLKIVYYGPGLSGKTTNLQQIHSVLSPSTKGKLLSLSTEADRTLFFDFLPVELGKIRDFSIRFQLYTVPGQVRYNATRKVVLKGADAVVFVADSQSAMKDQNVESFDNMKDNLRSNNINPDSIPILLQYNKRDLQDVMTLDEMNADLNKDGAYEVTESTAVKGVGVEETFRLITKLLLKDISKKHRIEVQSTGDKEETQKPAPPEPVAAPKPLFDEPMTLPPLPETVATAFPEEEEVAVEVVEELEEEAEAVALFEEETSAEAEAEAVTAVEPPLAMIDTAPAVAAAGSEPVLAIVEPAPVQMQKDIFPELSKEQPAITGKKPDEEKPGRPSFRDSIAEPSPKPRAEKVPPPLPPRPLFEQPSIEKPEPEVTREPAPPKPAPQPGVAKPGKPDTDLMKVSSSIERTGLVVVEIRNALASLKLDIVLLKNELAAIKTEIAAVKTAGPEKPPAPPAVDPKAIKEILREQAEIISSIREISQILNTLQEKKSWFKF